MAHLSSHPYLPLLPPPQPTPLTSTDRGVQVPYLLNSSMPPDEALTARRIDDYFQQELIDKRNERMAQRVNALLKEFPDKSFFFAFGAGKKWVSSYVLVQFTSVQSLDRLVFRRRWGGGHEGLFSRDPFSLFSAGGHCGQFLHGLTKYVDLARRE